MPLFVAILACVIDLKQSQASFLSHLTVWSYLQFAQMPTFQDLAIFVLTTTTDGQTDYFTACTQGNKQLTTIVDTSLPIPQPEKLLI